MPCFFARRENHKHPAIFLGVNGTGVMSCIVPPLGMSKPWGVRYLNLSESSDLQYTSTGQTRVYTGQQGTAFDPFATRNQFYGAVLRLRERYTQARWSAEFTETAALRVNHQVLDVTGDMTSTTTLRFTEAARSECSRNPPTKVPFRGTRSQSCLIYR